MDFDYDLAAAQEEAVEYMLRPECDGAALLAWDMGLGKTRTGLMFAKAYNARCVLVVVPLQTMEDWEKTAGVEYPELPVRIISSSAAGKKALAGFQWREEGIYLITHQYWESKAWVKQLVPKRRKADPDKFRKVDSGVWGGNNYLLIFDESHRSANADSWTFKALMNLVPHREGGPFKVAMSGTFMGDKFDGAYGATRWLWPHRTDIIPTNIFDWRAIWATVKYDPFAPRNQKVTGEKEEGAYVSSLPCYLRMESDQPKPIPHEVHVQLYPEQRRVYDELDAKMVAWIENDPLTAEYSITKRARQRQTALAMPTLTFDEETGELLDVGFADDAESVKIDALFREIDGEGELGDLMVGETALILTDSQKFARILTKRLNDRYGDVAREWSGKVTRPRRKKVKQAFLDGEIRYIVGVQSAMGTGTDGLQAVTRLVVFMSRADRRIDNEQGVSRASRKGQTRQVHVISFIADNTVDTGQLSNQLAAAIKAAKIMKAKERQRRQEEARERINALQEVVGF